MPVVYNAFTNNFDYVEDTSGFLTDIVITTNSGTATWTATGNLLGSGSLTVTGSGSTATAALTGLTNHAVLVGAGTDTVTKVGPSAIAGQVFQSGGSSADPLFSTATYPSTATGTGKILRADGTNWAASTATYPDTAGTIGNVLTSDGTNWVSSAATSGAPVFGYASGYYYFANLISNLSNASSTVSYAANALQLIPFYVSTSVTFNSLTFNVATASSAGTSCRVGIYNLSNGVPTTLISTLGTVLTDSTGNKVINFTQALTAGYYGIAIQEEATTVLTTNANGSMGSPLIPVGTSASTASNAPGITGYKFTAQAYGSGLPDLTGVTFNGDARMPIIQLKVA